MGRFLSSRKSLREEEADITQEELRYLVNLIKRVRRGERNEGLQLGEIVPIQRRIKVLLKLDYKKLAELFREHNPQIEEQEQKVTAELKNIVNLIEQYEKTGWMDTSYLKKIEIILKGCYLIERRERKELKS